MLPQIVDLPESTCPIKIDTNGSLVSSNTASSFYNASSLILAKSKNSSGLKTKGFFNYFKALGSKSTTGLGRVCFLRWR